MCAASRSAVNITAFPAAADGCPDDPGCPNRSVAATSDVKPEYFTKLPTIGLAVNSVNNVLLAHLGDAKATDTITTAIWSAIDEAAEVKDCDAYSFNPDRDLEPDAEEGNLWSFYFFFFNRRLKRMIFFTCRSVSSMVPIQPEEDELLMYDAEAEELVDDFRRTRSSQSLSLEQYMMQPFQLDI
nr:RNA polymerase III-inhibiting protein maf1 [Polyrhizophydium stewartii]